ncbi:MAG TPA: UDP-N-acetylglucosamine 2-epimerase (non-hydrolyzing) [Melioribacteraceae bacterium]|nr:UDP-N-acetylglucosamine 2-epimerase (non-hydrolyzing) [Melioribacteraceae bacterium]
MKIISVVGARPNFMKIAPIHKAFSDFSLQSSDINLQHLICHTGQHYDDNMSKVFFQDLNLPQPNYYLGVGSGTHAEQTAKIIIEFEKVLLSEKPDLVIVVGDVNSTIACSLTAVKFSIKVAHVEAGLRSFDRNMPEEINRILTDQISDYLFVTEKSGLENLKKEGIYNSKIFFVGNTMIDTLIYYLPKAEESKIIDEFGLIKNNYVLATLHRPGNVDEKVELIELISLLNKIADRRKIIFPIHPRTKNNLVKFGLMNMIHPNINLTDPVGYIDFISLIKNAELIITDSGGIQEESTYLGVQCITLRNSTERPITVEVGTNQLLGNDLNKALAAASDVLSGKIKKGSIPELWDGHAAKRIVKILLTKESEIHLR